MLKKAQEESEKMGGEVEIAEPLPANKMEERKNRLHAAMGRQPEPPSTPKVSCGDSSLDW